MKKVLPVLLAVIIIFSLSGCFTFGRSDRDTDVEIRNETLRARISAEETEDALTLTPQTVPTSTPEPTVQPTATVEPLYREDMSDAEKQGLLERLKAMPAEEFNQVIEQALKHLDETDKLDLLDWLATNGLISPGCAVNNWQLPTTFVMPSNQQWSGILSDGFPQPQRGQVSSYSEINDGEIKRVVIEKITKADYEQWLLDIEIGNFYGGETPEGYDVFGQNEEFGETLNQDKLAAHVPASVMDTAVNIFQLHNILIESTKYYIVTNGDTSFAIEIVFGAHQAIITAWF